MTLPITPKMREAVASDWRDNVEAVDDLIRAVLDAIEVDERMIAAAADTLFCAFGSDRYVGLENLTDAGKAKWISVACDALTAALKGED